MTETDTDIAVEDVVAWRNKGKRHKGTVCAFVFPGENAFEKYPFLQFAPGAKRRFQARSDQTRVIVEEPRDGRGGKHFSRFYAPLLLVLEKNLERRGNGGERFQ